MTREGHGDTTGGKRAGETAVPSEVLPDVDGLIVACDTETSGTHADDGARCSIVSIAYWPPGEPQRTDNIEAWAFPYDQGPLDKPGVQATLFDGNGNGEAGSGSGSGSDINLPTEEWRALTRWLARQHLVFHNAYFDLQILNKGLRNREHETGIDLSERVLHDTMLAAWVLDPTESKGLKPTAVRQGLMGGGEDDDAQALKPWLAKTKKRYDLVPWDVIAPYATTDAILTLLLARAQWAAIEESAAQQPDPAHHIHLEMQTSKILTRMAYRGVGYDLQEAQRSRTVLQQQRQKMLEQMPFQPATPASARRWFYKTCQALPHCVTNGGVASVGECCIRTLQAQGVPGAKQWAELSKTTHAIEKYYEGYTNRVGDDGRLRTDYVQAGTVTMRFASQRVNLQAIPNDYQLAGLAPEAVRPKQLFKARRGWRLYEFDYAQAELRIAAKKAKCERMLELIVSGADVHADTADQLFGGHDKQQRNIAKRANFSLIYGVGGPTFRTTVEKFTGIVMGATEADDIVRKWRALYPQFMAINRKAEMAAQANRRITLVDGRLYVFRPYDEERKAFNAWVQASLAQTVKRWMVAVDQPASVEVLLQVHDSLIVEVLWADGGGPQRLERVADTGSQLATDLFGVSMVAEYGAWGAPVEEEPAEEPGLAGLAEAEGGVACSA